MHSERIDSLIIIDRRVDLITPLLTQLTYEGLVDELFGIKNCMYVAQRVVLYSHPFPTYSTCRAAGFTADILRKR